MATTKTTRDHEEIRRWAEARGAVPAEVASTHQGDEPGILRFEFPNAPGHRDENLRPISWDDFFKKFDENNLELLYQKTTAEGAPSNFNKMIHPESEEHSSHKTASSHTKASGSGTGSAKKSSGSASKKSASGEKSSSKSAASASSASGAKKGATPAKSHSSSRKHSAA
ncbi:MAG: hypothetical protein QOH85_2164 [Acidobacteriaceae bacterium]|nr:hypothetical protein [Acidobacteriaceae bacterium]